MIVLLLLVTLTACAAAPQDLSGKMLTFPDDTSHVRVGTSTSAFTNATVCLRSFTDLPRGHSLFSLATASNTNAFLIFKESDRGNISVHAARKVAKYAGLDYTLNKWHSICATLDAASGLAQLWFDGSPSVKKYLGRSQITGPTVVLGQEQDRPGGGFELDQSFVGMLSDVHMWDYVLSSCEIQRFVADLNFTPGNVINWAALQFNTTGRVLIENRQTTCLN